MLMEHSPHEKLVLGWHPIRAGLVRLSQRGRSESIRRTYRPIPRYRLDIRVGVGAFLYSNGALHDIHGGYALQTANTPIPSCISIAASRVSS